ncbi:lysoplasmalogenase family protein [Glycomyces luteolus]|uniref:Lysoplasmalogenase family protein n=1 Tax=Glycomyces luteolus TaxID=2670330 RepID=A0A9X3P5Z2_9ACTN|nr:lysoplasmalogenase family protein [Glycomyces luteolus]
MPARFWLRAFTVAIAADLSAITFGADALRWASKPALALLLLGHLIVSTPPGMRPARLFGIGLLLACAADIALLVDGTSAFLWGMGLFGLMQITYFAVFVRLGGLPLRRRFVAPGCYLAVWLGANIILWPRLGDLAVPVAVYSLLLVAMAAEAVGVNRLAAAGGLLFVASDLVLGLGVAGIDFAFQDQAVMAAYAAAQLLLTLGTIKALPAKAPE